MEKIFLAIILTTLLCASLAAAEKTPLIAPAAEARYHQLSPALAEMLFPSHRPPRIVLASSLGGGLITAERFAYRVDNPAGLLARLRSEFERDHPGIIWRWGGVFNHSGQTWSAWEFSLPAVGGNMDGVVVGLPWGSGILVMSFVSESGLLERVAEDIERILGSVALQTPSA